MSESIDDKQWPSLKTVEQEIKLLPPTGGANHNFGYSILSGYNRILLMLEKTITFHIVQTYKYYITII